MNHKKIAYLHIIIALVTALAITISSMLYPEYYPNSMYIIIALWVVIAGLVDYLVSKRKNKLPKISDKISG